MAETYGTKATLALVDEALHETGLDLWFKGGTSCRSDSGSAVKRRGTSP